MSQSFAPGSFACYRGDTELVRARSGPAQLGSRLLIVIVATILMATNSWGTDSWAANPDESLLPFAVNVHQTPMQVWGPGYGIYLRKGVFITAAHVAGHTLLTRPKVTIDGTEYPTHVVKEGSFEGTDLTLLSIDEALLPMRLRLRRNALCAKAPWPGEEVVTVVPEGTARSHVLAAEQLPAAVRRFGTVIADVARTGNSGSGVFDTQRKCLLGIMSRKISVPRTRNGRTETVDIAKYFVPASEIAAFLPAELQSDQ